MKRLIYIALSLFLFVGSANIVKAGEKEKALTEQQKIQLEQISKRVEEIKNMDKSNLSRQEKKELRNELTTMKKNAKAISNGGIYLSVTALLVIIIILLLL